MRKEGAHCWDPARDAKPLPTSVASINKGGTVYITITNMLTERANSVVVCIKRTIRAVLINNAQVSRERDPSLFSNRPKPNSYLLNLIYVAPSSLGTLSEIAAALRTDDANYAMTAQNQVALNAYQSDMTT